MRVEKDYEGLLKLLNKNKVRYCIIGSYAIGFYSTPRYTKGIDILIDPTEKNAEKILSSLTEFGFGSLNLKIEDFTKKDMIIQLGYEPLRIDIITSIKTSKFSQIWKTKKKGVYGKQKVYFIGLKELIKSKRNTGRKIDKFDIENLNKI